MIYKSVVNYFNLFSCIPAVLVVTHPHHPKAEYTYNMYTMQVNACTICTPWRSIHVQYVQHAGQYMYTVQSVYTIQINVWTVLTPRSLIHVQYVHRAGQYMYNIFPFRWIHVHHAVEYMYNMYRYTMKVNTWKICTVYSLLKSRYLFTYHYRLQDC